MAINLDLVNEPVSPITPNKDESVVRGRIPSTLPNFANAPSQIRTFNTGKDDYSLGYQPKSSDPYENIDALREYKSTQQSDWAKASNVIKRGVPMAMVSMIEPFAAVGDLEQLFTNVNQTENEYGNWLSKWLRDKTEQIQAAAPIYTYDENPTLGSADWFYKNGDQIIKSVGYFVPGMAFTKAFAGVIKGINLVEGIAGMLGEAGITAANASKVSTATGNLLSAFGSGVVNNYSEHLLSAMDIFDKRKNDYYVELNNRTIYDGMLESEKQTQLKKNEDEAKVRASQDAEEVIAKGKWNIILNTIEYFNLFKPLKATRTAVQTSRLARLGKLGITSLSEGVEELNTNFFEDEANRNFDIWSGKAYEGDSSVGDRYLENATTYDAQTEALAGFIGGGGMQIVSDVKGFSARRAVRKSRANMEDTFSDKGKYSKLADANNFYDKLVEASVNGTMDDVEAGINKILSLTDEEAASFGLKEDYKEQAAKYLQTMAEFESDFNQLSDRYKDTANKSGIIALTTAKHNLRESEKTLKTLYADATALKAELPKSDDARVDLLKDKIADVDATTTQLYLAELELNSMTDDVTISLNTNETRPQIQERVNKLRDKQARLLEEYNIGRKQFMDENLNKDNDISDATINSFNSDIKSIETKQAKLQEKTGKLEAKRAKLVIDNTSYKNAIKAEKAKPKEEQNTATIKSAEAKIEKSEIEAKSILEDIDNVNNEIKQFDIDKTALITKSKEIETKRKAREQELEKSIYSKIGKIEETTDEQGNKSTNIKYSTKQDKKYVEILNDIKLHESMIEANTEFINSLDSPNALKEYNKTVTKKIADKAKTEKETFNTKLKEVTTLDELNKLKLKYTGVSYKAQLLKKETELRLKNKINTKASETTVKATETTTTQEEAEQQAAIDEILVSNVDEEGVSVVQQPIEEDNNEDNVTVTSIDELVAKDEDRITLEEELEAVDDVSFINRLRAQSHDYERELNSEKVNYKYMDKEFLLAIPQEYIDELDYILDRLAKINTVEAKVLTKLFKLYDNGLIALNNKKNLKESKEDLDGEVNAGANAFLEDANNNGDTKHLSISAFASINNEIQTVKNIDGVVEKIVVEKGVNNKPITVGYKIVEAASAFAYLSREYIKVYKKDGVRYADSDSKKNGNLVEELETNDFPIGTKIVISVDTEYSPELDAQGEAITKNKSYDELLKEYKEDSNEFLDNVPIKIQAEIDGKLVTVAYIHTTDWVDKNVAEWVYNGLDLIDNKTIQLDKIVALRKAIYEAYLKGESIESKVSDKSIGHPMTNLQVDGNGNVIYKQSGKYKGYPIIARDTVDNLLPSVKVLGVIKGNQVFIKEAQALETNQKVSEFVGVTVAVVVAPNGQNAFIPLIAPKIGSNNVMSTTLNSAMVAYFNGTQNELASLVDTNGEEIFDRSNISTFKSFLQRYIYVASKVSPESKVPQIGFNKEGQLYFTTGGDSKIIYTAKKSPKGDFTFYTTKYRSVKKDGEVVGIEQMETEKIDNFNKFAAAFNSALSNLRFSTKLANMNKAGRYEEIQLSRAKDINNKEVVIVKNIVQHKSYNDFIKTKLKTIFKEGKTSKGTTIYFDQPNIIFDTSNILPNELEVQSKEIEITEVQKTELDDAFAKVVTDEVVSEEKVNEDSSLNNEIPFPKDEEDDTFADFASISTLEEKVESITDLEAKLKESLSDFIIPEINNIETQEDIIDTLLQFISSEFMLKNGKLDNVDAMFARVQSNKFKQIRSALHFTDSIIGQLKTIDNVNELHTYLNSEIDRLELVADKTEAQDNELNIKIRFNNYLTKFVIPMGVNTVAELKSKLEVYDKIIDPIVWNKIIKIAGNRLSDIGLVNLTGTEIEDNNVEDESETVYERTKFGSDERLKLNPILSISGELKLFLSTIPIFEVVNGERVIKKNTIGFNKHLDANTAYSVLIAHFADKVVDADSIKNKLLELAEVDYMYQFIHDAITNPKNEALLTSFVNGLSKHKLSLASLLKFKVYREGILISQNYKLSPNNRKGSASDIATMLINAQDNSSVIKIEDGIKSVNDNLIKGLNTTFRANYSKGNVRNNVESLRIIFDSLGLSMIDNNLILDFVKLIPNYTKQKVEDALDIENKKSFIYNIINGFKVGLQVDLNSSDTDKSLHTDEGRLALIQLAKFLKDYSNFVIDLSSMNAKNEKIYEMQNHNRLSMSMNKVRNNDSAFLDNMLNVPFSSNSLLLNAVRDKTLDVNLLKLLYFDSSIISSNTKITKSSSERADLTRSEHNIAAMSLFQASSIENDKFASYFGLTFGDSSISPIITLQRHDINLKFTGNGQFKLSNKTKDLLYNSALSEINRILSNRLNLNSNKYVEGFSNFVIFDELTEDSIKQFEKDGILEEGTSTKLYINGVFSFDGKTTSQIEVIKDVLEASYINKINTLFDELVEDGLIVKIKHQEIVDGNLMVSTKYVYKEYADSKYETYVNKKVDSTKTNNTDAVKYMVADFYINNAVSLLEQYTLFSNDPIYYAKFNDDGSVDREGTLINLQKRLKGILSPFILGNHIRKNYRRLHVQDLKRDSAILKSYVKRMIGGGYSGMTISDAQEFMSFIEALEYKLAYDKISIEDYKRLLKEYNATEDKSTFVLDAKDLTLFQPEKPMSFEDSFDGTTRSTAYTKSSAFVLLPQFTKGLEIDKLRMLMDESNIDRVSFKTADKLAYVKPVALFNNKSGKIIATKESIQDGIVTMTRDMSGLQQVLPTGKEKILVVSQANLLEFNNIRHLDGFIYKGKSYTAKQLEVLKEDTKKELFEIEAAKIVEQLGYNEETQTITDYTNIQELLMREARARNWSILDIQQLKLTANKEFETALIMNNSFDNIQSVLTSVINKVIKSKFHGKPYIQGSSAGFTTLEKNGKTGISFTDKFEGRLLPMRIDETTKQVLPAQMIVAWNFRDATGKLLDITKFYKEGTNTIDFEKLPVEVLRGIGMRIPNQSHSSMMPFEIVGFLPSNMADLAIVPEEIVNQMGSDFDIDKLYAYLNNYFIDLKGDVKLLSEDNRVKVTESNEELVAKLDTIKANIEEYKTTARELRPLLKLDATDNIKLQKKINRFQATLTSLNSEKLKSDYMETIRKIKILDAFSRENMLKQDYVDIKWSVLTNEKVYDSIVRQLDLEDLKLEYKALKISKPKSLLDWGYHRDSYISQQMGGKLISTMSVANILNATIQDLNMYLQRGQGKNISRATVNFHNNSGKILKLTNLSGTGTSTYIHEEYSTPQIRTKSDVITILQNAAVDNANFPLLGELNINSITANVATLMAMLETEDGEAIGIDTIAGFMNQPVMIKYVEVYNRLLTEGISRKDAPYEAISEINGQFDKTIYSDYVNNFSKYANADNFQLSPKNLKMFALNKYEGEHQTEVIQMYQMFVLSTYLRLQGFADSMSMIQSTTLFSIRKGTGKSIYEALSKSTKLESVAKITNISNPLSILKKVEHKAAKKNTLDLALKTITKALGLHIGTISSVFKTLEEESGGILSTDDYMTITQSVRRYLISGKKEVFDNTNLQGRRKELLFGSSKVKPLGVRIEQIKTSLNNDFLNNINVTSISNKGTQYYLTMAELSNVGLNDYHLINQFLELLTSDNKEVKTIAQDIIEYSYIFGTMSTSFNFSKFIPNSYLKALGINESLRGVMKDLRLQDSYNLYKQIVQHNINFANTYRFDEKTKLVNGNLLNANIVTSTKKNRFIKIYNTENKPMLFENVGYTTKDNNKIYHYVRINTLGNAFKVKGMKDVFEYNFDGNTLSILDQNNNIYVGNIPHMESETKVNASESVIDGIQKLNNVETKYYLGIVTKSDITNSHELLKVISNSNEEYSELVGTLLAKIIPNIDVVETPTLKGKEAIIQFSDDNTYTPVRIKIKDFNSPQAMRIGYHELIHSALGQRMQLFLKGKTEGFSPAEISILTKVVETFNSIKTEVLKDANNAAIIANMKEALKNELSVSEQDRILYGMTNVHEFMSEVLTNVEFQKFLNTIPYEDATMLDRILKLIAQLAINVAKSLGVEVNKQSALFAGLAETLNLIEFYANPELFEDTGLNTEAKVLPESTKTSKGIKTNIENINVIPLSTNFTRKSVEQDSDYLYLFTDNAARTSGSNTINKDSKYLTRYGYEGMKSNYPTMTQAVIRGLDNAFAITTMVNDKRLQWEDDSNERINGDYKNIIDNEIEIIKSELNNYKGIKFAAQMPIGKGKISNMSMYAPKTWEYLNKKLKEIGIDNTGNKPTVVDNQLDLFASISANDRVLDKNTLYQNNTNQSIEEYVATEKTIRELAARLSNRIGIDVKFESDRTKDYKGKIENNTAVINLAHATLDTPIHEILGHPIIRTIKDGIKLSNFTYTIDDISDDKNAPGNFSLITFNDITGGDIEIFDTKEEAETYAKNQKLYAGNKELYNNLLKELETGKGKEVLDRIKRTYIPKPADSSTYSLDDNVSFPDFGSQEDYDGYLISHKEYQQEEAIVELLGLMTANKLDSVKDKSLIEYLKMLLTKISDFIRSLMLSKEIEISKLPDNVTLNDLANIFAFSNSKLILPNNEVQYTTPDNRKFKTYQEASNHISELTKTVTDIDLDAINSNHPSIGTLDPYTNKIIKDVLRHNVEAEPSGHGGYNMLDVIYEDNSKKTIDLNEVPYDEEDSKIQNYYYEMAIGVRDINGFINRNKEFEQSKEIIEEWKRSNNIKYNPEEVYSRGQGFYSVVGAYSSLDVNLMFQNLIPHIEDNVKSGGAFVISAFTRPVEGRLKHIEDDGGKIRIKIFPKSEDIKWAADRDVYSGSVWDAGEKMSTKQKELLGISYTKAPSISTIINVKPNLSEIIDGMRNNHNELGIELTTNNFRLEYDDNIPYSTKKIIDGINKILDDKYGELTQPIINKESNDKYEVIDLNDEVLHTTTSLFKARTFIKNTENDFIYGLKVVEYKNGIEPIINSNSIKESIKDVVLRYSYKLAGTPDFVDKSISKEEYESKILSKTEEVNRSYWENIPSFQEHATVGGIQYRYFDEQGNVYFRNKEDNTYKKRVEKEEREYTNQAIVNTKITALKNLARKYPRSLIRSEVKKIERVNLSDELNLFDEMELPFQKVSKFDSPNTQLLSVVYEALKIESRDDEYFNKCN